jgi:hypothetical protein
MRLRGIIALAVACVIAGCSDEPIDRSGSAGWTKPNATATSFQTDSDACRRAVMVVPVRTVSSPVGERQRLFNGCMAEHGWTLDPHIAKDGTLGIVNCKLPSIEQVQRMSVRDCMNRLGKVL